MVLNLDDMRVGVDSDFAASAFHHLSEAVRRLTADHDRAVDHLRKENQELQRQLNAALAQLSTSSQSQEQAVSQSGTYPDGARQNGDKQDKVDTTDPSSANVVMDTSTSPPPHTTSHAADMDEAAREIEGKDEEDSMRCWARMKRLVKSPKFDSIIGVVIVGNTMTMALQLEYSGRVFKDQHLDKCGNACANWPYGGVRELDSFFSYMEHVFTGIFFLELVIRLVIMGCRYLCSISNLLDALVVLVSCADSWILGPLGSDVMGSVAVLRLMRLMRLAKVLRVVRVMKAFRSLRILVSAVVNSVGALGWSMTLLFVLELIGAIFMAQVIEPFMREEGDSDLQWFMYLHFGTWINSMFTLFEITMAPGGFIKYRVLYEEVNPLFLLFFVLYVCVVTFAVVRVITAMFLKATLSASDSDEQDTAREKSEQWSNYVRSLELANSTDNGTINHEDLDHLLSVDHFAEWLDEVGLATFEVKRIFSALDQGEGEVLFSEFENALRQMRGLPRAADVVINLYETRNILLRLIRMETRGV
jgi:membrane protein implicated in regulation of membrane protease activity